MINQLTVCIQAEKMFTFGYIPFVDNFYDYQFSVYFLLTYPKRSTVLTCCQFNVAQRIASLYFLIHVIWLCSGEHTDADTLPHRLRRVRRHVQCEALHPSPEVRHDPGGAECVRSLRGYLRASTLHSGMSVLISHYLG